MAEEVSLDLQSARTRQLGSLPRGPAAQAVAETLQPAGAALDEAIERTLPPPVWRRMSSARLTSLANLPTLSS